MIKSVNMLGAKSYIRKGFLVYEEMRECFIIYIRYLTNTQSFLNILFVFNPFFFFGGLFCPRSVQTSLKGV
jgi:hypothetical protein